MSKRKGILIIVSGPAGSGKGTVVKELVDSHEEIELSVSATTRNPRPGEINGVHYHFIDKAEFENRIANGEILEYTTYCENYYGTPLKEVKRALAKGKDIVLEIEVDGAMQVKTKFPDVTVAVDKSRNEGCHYLCHPNEVRNSRKTRHCKNKFMPKADLIILDDAFQHRSIKATASIVLVDYNRPIFKDHLLPIGRLRDLPERIEAADIVIISKCPPHLDAWERSKWAEALGIRLYDGAECCGKRDNGKTQYILPYKSKMVNVALGFSVCWGTNPKEEIVTPEQL